ncbi:hypothetical protein [Candidatus Halobonum tyrrellensis]|uniref:Uncharacterized protein n=1 Tax=Candidatus Halobonum tyrrellensis G22 TaxID=1324957 RepID=V4HFY8_9EURY|nr:hypothetical protein [Candidatus Halobonum tyrrellensis]ESP89625.1 hypothetical protein K933_02871 [Candidatus Halobonum tyrrellensis G22]
MADLSRAAGGRDRAQLFVVGALALATTFVVLAVVLNSVIYAGAVATRDDGTHAGPALAYDRQATAAAADAVREVSRESTNDTAADALAARVVEWRAVADRHLAYRNAVGDVTVTATTPGTYAGQTNASRALVPAGDEANASGDWTLVTDARVRAYEAAVEPDSALSDATVADGSALRDAALGVRFENATGSVWTVTVYRNDTHACVKTFSPGGTATPATCRPGTALAVSFADATVNGTDAPALEFLSPSEPYTVGYRNGHAATGTYGFVARRGAGDPVGGPVEAGNFAGEDAAASPFYSAGVYAADLRVNYRNRNVWYATNVTVAPGEFDG